MFFQGNSLGLLTGSVVPLLLNLLIFLLLCEFRRNNHLLWSGRAIYMWGSLCSVCGFNIFGARVAICLSPLSSVCAGCYPLVRGCADAVTGAWPWEGRREVACTHSCSSSLGGRQWQLVTESQAHAGGILPSASAHTGKRLQWQVPPLPLSTPQTMAPGL